MARRKTVTEAEMRLTARDHTRAVISRVQRSLRTLSRAAVRVGAAMAGGFAVGSAALTQMTRRGLENVDAMAKQADMVNIGTEALAGFQRQAQRAGIPVDTFNRNLERMSVSLAQAEQGLGTAGRGLESIGLQIEDVAGLQADEQLFAIARAMEDVESHAVRTAAAYDIFGQRGVRMLKIMEQGEDAMRKANLRAVELGLTVSRFDAAKVEQANDSWDEMGQLITGLQNQFAVQFAPIITAISERLVQAAEDLGGMGPVAERVFDFIVRGAGTIGDAFRRFQIITKQGEIGLLAIGNTAIAIARRIDTFFADVFGAQIDRVNDLIHKYNMLALINPLMPMIPTIGEVDRKLTNLGEGFANALIEAQLELQQLMGRDMPSEAIDRFVEHAKARADEFAQATVDGMMTIPSAAGEAMEETEQIVEQGLGQAGQFVVNFGNHLENALVNASMQGKFAISDLAKFVIAEINRMIIRTLILRNLFGGLGNVFGGDLGAGFTEAAQSFAGGGSTGSGPRTGGLDGRGGFPAILHPNETVVDHSQGQQTGGTYYIDARGADSGAIARLENMIANMGGRIRNESQAAVQQAFQRNPQFGTR